jgi:hypothetical protein
VRGKVREGGIREWRMDILGALIREGEGFWGRTLLLDQGEICVWDLHIGPGLLEVLGSEGQDIRRYPGARLFS